MNFHIDKSKFEYTPIEEESVKINNLFFKKNGTPKKNSSLKRFYRFDEHEIVDSLSKNEYYQQSCYLLFYHWYERKYQINLIQNNNNILFNEIPNNSLITEIYVRKKELHNDVRLLLLNNLSSSKFKGFSVYYEYYYDFFPNIEKFSLKEVVGREFLIYLLDLFPHISSVTHGNGNYQRFSRKILVENTTFENLYGWNILKYTNGLPNFNPRINDRILEHTYNPFSLLTKEIRDLEDEVRLEKELPKIGEGWISETSLYYELKNHFNTENVIHHGHPSWLGKQHVDIWLPKHNIGIEYQGKQHDEPVEFFGGEESFIKNKERDKRKKRLFKENNSDLIEVREGFSLIEIVNRIQRIINKQSRD